MRWKVVHGGCLEVLEQVSDNKFDSVVCDPPYNLNFMGNKWDTHINFQEWCQEWAAECLRVLKPGGHLLSFGGTRTFHRLTCGIEDAGFEIRDCLMWLYGSGFPKSLDVSKAIDKAAGAERAVVGESATLLQLKDHDNGIYGGWKGKERTEGGGPLPTPSTGKVGALRSSLHGSRLLSRASR